MMGDSFSAGTGCKACGGISEPGERFCWRCGEPLPQRRQVSQLSVFVGVGFVIVFVAAATLLRSDPVPDGKTVEGGQTTSTTSQAATSTISRLPETRTLAIGSAVCTSDLSTHPCEFAVDGDPTTAWNAPGGGIGAEIVIELAEVGRVTRLVITNHPDDEDLARNARIARLIVHFAGSDEEIDVSLEGSHGPYSVRIPLVETSSISLHIEEVHPAEGYGGNPPFDELAVVEIQVVGVPSEISR